MKFKGGVHPAYNKVTADLEIVDVPLMERYVVPLAQHLGAPGAAIVAKGDEVKRGQPLSEAQGFVSVPVHAPTSGVVKSVKALPHPLGRPMMSVEITADGEDEWHESVEPRGDWRFMSPDELRGCIRDAGIVGMGGATFPTHVKLSPPADKPVDILVLNGAECEPYLTSDHRTMLEMAREVMEGVGLMMRVLDVTTAWVGVESNKPDAVAAMKAVAPTDLDIRFALLETKYPQGSEKHLIQAMTGRVVPSGGLPMDVGCVVQNVGTAAACYEAVALGRPMTDRICTVTGKAVEVPRNIRMRVGTLLIDVLRFCGGVTEDVGKIIYGGPMMGMGQFDTDVPVIKGTSGILCLPESQVAQFEGGPCIRCGNCVDVCPMGLVPSAMGLLSERSRFDELGDYAVLDCIECGSCAYVCPSHRPLVQLFKRGKVEWRQIEQTRRAKAEAAAGGAA